MSPEIEELYISPAEIERVSKLEVSDHIIGGLLWGTYRWPLVSPQRLLTVVITELLMVGVSLMFATPVGVVLSRNLEAIDRVVGGIVAIALCLYTIRQLWMIRRAFQLRGFMRLLDEVDHYHQVLEAVELLNQLGSIDSLEIQITTSVAAALNKARESLVAALITEKILRSRRGLLSRREALIEKIEENLLTLRSLELQHQAQDYGNVLDQALNIGLRVQHEVHQLTRES